MIMYCLPVIRIIKVINRLCDDLGVGGGGVLFVSSCRSAAAGVVFEGQRMSSWILSEL